MQSQFTVSPLPDFFIGKNLTSERISNYAQQKHGLLTQALGRADTKSVWYSKEHIACLLEEIEHANGDGLRIFFGAYESTHEFANQTCLLMVVTREKLTENNSAIHGNIIMEDEPDFAERASLQREISLPNENDRQFTSKRGFNHGSPCPPLCDGADGFEFS